MYDLAGWPYSHLMQSPHRRMRGVNTAAGVSQPIGFERLLAKPNGWPLQEWHSYSSLKDQANAALVVPDDKHDLRQRERGDGHESQNCGATTRTSYSFTSSYRADKEHRALARRFWKA